MCAAALQFACAAPRISCEDPLHDCGTVTNSNVVNHTFNIRNEGDSVLVIESVRTGCGCLASSLQRNRLEPGESVPLAAELSLKGRTGRQDKSIYLHSNDPVTPILRLSMVTEIRRSIDVSPPHLVFSTAEEVRQGWKDVLIRAGTEQSFAVTRVDLDDSEYFKHRLEEVTPGRLYRIRVELTDAGRAPGSSGLAAITVATDDPRYARLEIPLSVSSPREIIVAPGRLVLRRASNKPERRALLVHSPYAALLGVTVVSVPAAGIRSSVARLEDGRFRIDLENIPALEAGAGGEVVLRADRENGRTETVRVPVIVE